MSANFVLLEKVTVGASVSSVTFNNIPQTGYTDLVVKYSARSTTSGSTQSGVMRINGDTGTNYNYKNLYGDGSSAGSGNATGAPYFYVGAWPAASGTANTFSNGEVYIPNYTSSNYKSVSIDYVGEANATGAQQLFEAGIYPFTSAITSLTFLGYSDSIAQYSTFSLYGIAAVGTTPTVAPFAAGGDIIQTDGTYWYHAFLSSGTFTPAKSLSCDVLVVAGGGGAGFSVAGGGGAGGLLGFTSQALASNTAQTVLVGAGGPGRTSGATPQYGIAGSNSQFASLTAAVGGGGSNDFGNTATNNINGGSGAGGPGANSGTINGGTGVSGQGYAGGSGGYQGSYRPSGGGGGAGGVGANGSGNNSGAGGVGATYNTTVGGTAGPYAFIDAMGAATGTGQLVSGHYYYAGGGGGGCDSSFSNPQGGAGGYGGGGAGGSGGDGHSGANATANTGGGGGGAGGNGSNGGNGGSGITIIRYLA